MVAYDPSAFRNKISKGLITKMQSLLHTKMFWLKAGCDLRLLNSCNGMMRAGDKIEFDFVSIGSSFEITLQISILSIGKASMISGICKNI